MRADGLRWAAKTMMFGRNVGATVASSDRLVGKGVPAAHTAARARCAVTDGFWRIIFNAGSAVFSGVVSDERF